MPRPISKAPIGLLFFRHNTSPADILSAEQIGDVASDKWRQAMKICLEYI